MKSYTDIEQSRKLAEILPLESADMYYQYVLPKAGKIKHNPEIGNPVNALKWYNKGYTTSGKEPITLDEYCVPCWSLSVLLDVFPYYEINNSGVNIELSVKGVAFITEKGECLLDLAVNMIIHLHELKML
jgi:hypothetical protein